MLDPTLVDTVKSLQQKLEQLKNSYHSRFSKRLIDKACHDHYQSEAKKSPAIFMPSQEAVLFYKKTCQPQQFENILLEAFRANEINKLFTLGLDHHLSSAVDTLLNMRKTQLKKYLQPGEIATLLEKKGLIEKSYPSSTKTKKVRFV